MLYAGHGCRDAQQEVMHLAEKLNAPLGFSFRGKIFFDKEDNDYAVGEGEQYHSFLSCENVIELI